ncbi:DUF2155 domain-containing protein [Falsirhodobacter algicola]|uniref:DUF2155 domain-containing protein n=1 Tax=Falsirhodobacter algicola TaxID=2692330 RepID=A0A8J8SKL9_9RHOB|nr:DUF2155 domain-containing protein [Falsirhodobacter algicola]QUS35547.1 DUF2155 domain-containing protein [Falsirhodobacter algicola]
MKALVAAVLIAAAPAAYAQEAATAPGATLRWLDKTTGQTDDFSLSRGQSVTRGFITIRLDECRYPAADPSSDAYAHLTIMDTRASTPVFSGWMISSSPALSALDHPRYDVWVLECET